LAEKKDLNKYIQKQISEDGFKESFDRTAKYDKEFAQFLKDFKEKNKEFPTIIDLTRFTKDN
jgi:hypothetical protein